MILKRIGTAAREHDWFVVVVELLIVVTGIFVGLRVERWSSEREERIEEQRYVALLEEDVRTMLEEVQRLAERAREQQAVTRSAILSLQNRDDGPETVRDIETAVIAYQVSPPFPLRRATYDEMVATGVFARLSDRDLKQALTDTFAELELARSSVDRFRVSLPVVDQIVWSRVEMRVDTAGRTSVRVDPRDLFEDTEFRNAMIEMLDIQFDVGSVYSRLEPLLSALLQTVRQGAPAAIES